MLNVYYDIVEANNFTPYLTLGAGISTNKTKSFTNIKNSVGFSKTAYYANATQHSFAYKAGVGTKFLVSKNFDLDLRYQYSDLGKFKTGTLLGDNNISNIAAKKGKLRAHEVLVGIAYKF